MSLLITDAGIAASIQAAELGVSYKITHISMGAAGYVPAHNQTTLRDEIIRKTITQGSVPALGQLHFEVLFDGNIEYEAREIGYFLEDGTLFAVDSRDGDIISIKRSDTVITEVFDLTLSGSEIETITVEIIGAANATERVAGIAKIITNEQVDSGVDDSTFLTIKKMIRAFDAPYLINKLVNNLWLKLAAKIFPVGAAIPWFTDIAPDGFGIMKNQAFDLVANPELAKIWPDGIIPDMRGCGVMGKFEGESVGDFEEGQVKKHGHSGSVSAGGQHGHSRGTMEITGSTTGSSPGSSVPVNIYRSSTGAFTLSGGGAHDNGSITANRGGRSVANFTASRSWTGVSSTASAHTHALLINAFGALKNTIDHRKVNWIVRMA
ncbi:phage tail-collar fiber domain-containing protein [Aliivibrio wodanis]|uniref:phage tail-collar fiber domain-containing protein n=1 Tax=Aliivibrio wodanis TaxID=80852 RepID=UPI00406C028C